MSKQRRALDLSPDRLADGQGGNPKKRTAGAFARFVLYAERLKTVAANLRAGLLRRRHLYPRRREREFIRLLPPGTRPELPPISGTLVGRRAPPSSGTVVARPSRRRKATAARQRRQAVATAKATQSAAAEVSRLIGLEGPRVYSAGGGGSGGGAAAPAAAGRGWRVDAGGRRPLAPA